MITLHIKNKDEVISELNKKKRLGQYFSGEKLSKLLSAFAVSPVYSSIIDPMCGKADMLVAASLVNNQAELYGIDIDAVAINAAKKNLENHNRFIDSHYLYIANALSTDIIRKLPFLQFDLVITNPPYVRYQTISKNTDDQDYPSAEEVRKSLLDLIKEMKHLDKEDKKIFTEIIKGYSGLSDLAVPSWILCCMLTKINGRLAMVVPESWLSRDYSYPIQYLLLKYFELEYVIEDVDRCWFKEAQIKTNLIIAKRRSRVPDLFNYYRGKQYVHIAVRKEYGDERSLIGNLIPQGENKELIFKNEIQYNLDKYVKEDVCQVVEISDTLENLAVNSKKFSWFKNTEGTYVPKNEGKENINIFPISLKKIVETSPLKFINLEDMGVKIGQGLRTGANKFFYVDYIKQVEEFSVVKVDKIFKKSTIKVPSALLAPVVRKQVELPSDFIISSTEITGRVLLLNEAIHPKDFEKIKELGINKQIMNDELANFIDEVETTNVGSEAEPKYIPNLSAVKTNITKMKNNDPNTINYWYMLRKMARRHQPDIFVPRIINQTPRFMLNAEPPIIIDANFSSIWLSNEAEIDKYGLVAVLNSSWFLLVCELVGTVMGGGALKLEATHLKKVPIPQLSKTHYTQLAILGKKLVKGDKSVIVLIDQLITEAVSPDKDNLLLKEIKVLTMKKRSARIKK